MTDIHTERGIEVLHNRRLLAPLYENNERELHRAAITLERETRLGTKYIPAITWAWCRIRSAKSGDYIPIF